MIALGYVFEKKVLSLIGEKSRPVVRCVLLTNSPATSQRHAPAPRQRFIFSKKKRTATAIAVSGVPQPPRSTFPATLHFQEHRYVLGGAKGRFKFKRTYPIV